jgi:PAS domain S-box-containing protein
MKAAGVSFRTMLFAMIAAVVVPLAALLPLAIQRASESQSELAREGARHLASTAAVAIDQAFADMRRSLEAAAERYDPAASGRAGCARFIATVKALQPNAANVAYGDRGGGTSCSVVPLPAGRALDLAEFPEFTRPITEGGTVLGEPMISPITGLSQILLSTPVRDRSGRIAGVLAMAIQLDVIRRLATGVVRDGRATLEVITPGGIIVAHAPDPEHWVGRSAVALPVGRAVLERGETRFDALGLDGVARLFGVARIPSTGWTVVAGLPEAETLAPIRRGWWLSLGLAAGVVLTAAGLAVFLARRLSRPVDAIVAAMQRAAAGAPDPRAPEGGPQEIALIGAEFNRMLAARTRLEAERHEALERAAAHEQRLANTFEAMTEAVGIIGADGRYELTNHAAEQLLGVPRERIVGSRFDDLPWKRVAADGALLSRDDHPFERLRRGEPAVRDYEFQVVPEKGKARTILVNAVPLRDAAGGFDGIVITGIDTTERRAAERRLRDVIETLAEGLVIIGADGRYELANRAEEELLGVPRERIIGTRFDAAPFGRAASDGGVFRIADHPFEQLRRGEAPLRNYEFQLVQPGGQVRTVLANAAPLRDAAGNFDGVVATCVDITERKRAEQRLGDVIEALAEGLILIGPEGRYELTNRAEEELLGVPRERIIGTSFDAVPWSRLTADGAPFRVDDHPFARLRRGEPVVRDYELQVVSPEGRARTVLASAVPLRDAAGNFDGAVLSAVDITERKRAERRLRDIIETMAEGLFIIAADGRYELLNRAAEELLATPRERAIGVRYDQAPWGRRAADGSAYRIEDHAFERLRRGEPAVRNREIQFVPANAPPRTVSVNAVPLRDAAGNFDGIVATFVDTTERKAVERRLRETIETMAEGLAIIGVDGRYELLNRAAEELLGVPRERLIGVRFDAVPWVRIAADGSPFRLEDHPFERLRRGETALRDYEYQVVPPRGRPRTILTNAAPLRDAAGNFAGIVATWADITERKNAERRLAEYSARLAALSRRVLTVQEEERRAVARELHDELGQVLTAVKVNLQALRRQSAPAAFGSSFEDSLALLDGAIAEVRAISTRLRPAVLDDLGLEAALRSHLERIRARTAMELAADIRLPQRRLDAAVETACFRIVQEAVTNALRHARADGLRVELGVESGELVLAVRDDGQGFDLAAATRRAAQGESAGLSGMEERARLAGGRLEVRTAPGRGTEVRALFRLAEAAP